MVGGCLDMQKICVHFLYIMTFALITADSKIGLFLAPMETTMALLVFIMLTQHIS